jgi:hypothetical protein
MSMDAEDVLAVAGRPKLARRVRARPHGAGIGSLYVASKLGRGDRPQAPG